MARAWGRGALHHALVRRRVVLLLGSALDRVCAPLNLSSRVLLPASLASRRRARGWCVSSAICNAPARHAQATSAISAREGGTSSGSVIPLAIGTHTPDQLLLGGLPLQLLLLLALGVSLPGLVQLAVVGHLLICGVLRERCDVKKDAVFVLASFRQITSIFLHHDAVPRPIAALRWFDF